MNNNNKQTKTFLREFNFCMRLSVGIDSFHLKLSATEFTSRFPSRRQRKQGLVVSAIVSRGSHPLGPSRPQATNKPWQLGREDGVGSEFLGPSRSTEAKFSVWSSEIAEMVHPI